MFQISSKSGNKWPSYSRLSEIQHGGGRHLGFGAKSRFNHFYVEYVALVLGFKFHQNRAINGRVMHDFVKFKMAAAAILDSAQKPRFYYFSVEYVTVVLCFKFLHNRTINGRVMQDIVKFKMAAAAILDVAQNTASTVF